MDQSREQRRSQKHERNDDQQDARIPLQLASFRYGFFKIHIAPNRHVFKHFINGSLISKAVGIMNDDLDRLRVSRCGGVPCPIHAAGRSTEQGVLVVDSIGLFSGFMKNKMDMVRIKEI